MTGRSLICSDQIRTEALIFCFARPREDGRDDMQKAASVGGLFHLDAQTKEYFRVQNPQNTRQLRLFSVYR
jgi:hypothetical protein